MIRGEGMPRANCGTVSRVGQPDALAFRTSGTRKRKAPLDARFNLGALPPSDLLMRVGNGDGPVDGSNKGLRNANMGANNILVRGTGR